MCVKIFCPQAFRVHSVKSHSGKLDWAEINIGYCFLKRHVPVKMSPAETQHFVTTVKHTTNDVTDGKSGVFIMP